MTDTLSGEVLGQLSAFLADRTGLYFSRDRWSDLERGISAACRESGAADVTSYSRKLLSSAWTNDQIESLARHLTVGETYFFRHQESIEILETRVLPELIKSRRASGRYLRIWSAGCCTGEEAYSIAILLRTLLPEWKTWNITVLATDINAGFLARARRGVYREWSFRETPPEFRRRYFTSGEKDCFEILPEIRTMVTFASLNLAGDNYPSLTGGTSAMDLILCRNVLMYFSKERAKHVVCGLHRSLVPGGWLAMGPSESSPALSGDFQPVSFPGAILFRKDGPGSTGDPMPWHMSPAESTRPSVWADPPAPPSLEAAQPDSTHRAESPADACAMAHLAANQGKLDEALTWCDKAVAADKLDPRCHYLAGVILNEHGRLDEASACLMRALYLDQNFVLAHFSLANLCQRQGMHKAAVRHFNNALRALNSFSPEDLLPESEGMSARRLGEIIRSATGPAMAGQR